MDQFPTPTESAQPRSQLERGARVGRYLLLDRLGEGGMGVVYAAWDPELDRRVAIKLIGGPHLSSESMLRRRLRREAQAMAKLRHENVVSVYDVGESDQHLFVAMEYVDGVNLRTWQESRRSGAEILAVYRAAGSGLAAAHAQGVVHRDFKPDNVIVARDGRVLVFDFGLASLAIAESSGEGAADDSDLDLDSALLEATGLSDEELSDSQQELTRPGAVLGTPGYMAPEQRRGRPTDARGDQYAFCVALWQALTGKLPFGRGSHTLARARLGKTNDFRRRDVPSGVERALRRGLAWTADDRWPDMGALLDALAPTRRRAWLAVAPAVVIAGMAGWVYAQGPAPESGPTCEDGTDRIEAVWNGEVSSRLADSFEAAGELGRQSWPFVAAEIDRWTARWVAADRELCERYGLGAAPEVHEQQLVCLDRQLAQLELGVDLLASVSDQEIERSFELVAGMPDPSSCRTPDIASEREAADPSEVAEIELAISRVELELRLARFDSAEQTSAELMQRTRGPGLASLHQRVVEARVEALVELERTDESVEVGLEGLEDAERNGDARLRYRAFAALSRASTYHQDPRAAQRWLELSASIAEGLELDHDERLGLILLEVGVATLDGRLEQALEANERALSLVDADEDRYFYLSMIMQKALALNQSGQSNEALSQLDGVHEELASIVGPNHPILVHLRSLIAAIQSKLEQYEDARANFLAAADALDAFYGRPTTQALAFRGRAARALNELGDCEAARAEFDELIPLAREHMPYPSNTLGTVLKDRAVVCAHATPEAVDYARQALALYRDAVGDEHVMIAFCEATLARTLLEAGELQAAREAVDRSLVIYAAIAPRGAELVDRTEELRALIRHRLGDPGALDGVEELLERTGGETRIGVALAEAVHEAR